MATNVYIDGFNVYHGILRIGQADPTASYKWLDPEAVVTAVWPTHSPLRRIRYFTALLKPLPADPQVPVRQQAYLRALRSRGVEIHLGLFKMRSRRMKLRGADLPTPAPVDRLILSAEAHVTKYDEKGSDVNLACYLLRDAALGDCDKAIVVSNDSDLAEAITIARSDFGIPVYVINPQKRVVAEIKQVASGVRSLMAATVLRSQYPPMMTDAQGVITKPPRW